MLLNIDLRHIQTGVRLTPSEVIQAQHDALCARTERRQREAKARLTAMHIEPRVQISRNYVPPSVARQFFCDSVGGAK